MITLRFVTVHDFAVSAAIRAFQYGFWASHVEAVMPDGGYLGAHHTGGVVNRQAGYDASNLIREAFLTLPSTQAQADSFHAFLRDQLGKPYDLTAIEGLVFQREWQKPDSWFCSELIAAALIASGWLPKMPAEVFKITPRDMMLIASARMAS